MSAQTAKQLKDGYGYPIVPQYYDPATDSYIPGTGPGAVPLDTSGNVPIAMVTTLAGENIARERIETVNAAWQNLAVPSGVLDYLLGTAGQAGDYIDHLDLYITDSTKSQVVIRDGVTGPVLSIATHASTASTATVINTVINAAAVAINQYKDCLLKVAGEYRRILAHAAFSAGVVNQYTLDRALTSAPATGVTVAIEHRDYVWELIPNGTAAGATQWDCRFASVQAGYRVTTESGVRGRAICDVT